MAFRMRPVYVNFHFVDNPDSGFQLHLYLCKDVLNHFNRPPDLDQVFTKLNHSAIEISFQLLSADK
jgi:hypothetical protein